MNFSAIDIQGNIVSGDILTQIKNDDIRFQKVTDFGLESGTALRDEIGIAWSAAQAHWKAFSLRRDRLKEKDTGTSETRQGWMIPFLRELGYDIESAKSYVINEKTYAISHKASNRDNFPIHIVGINQSLDKRAEHGTRLSPHALVQEFLNNHEHLYAIATNGKYLRLLRDATRLSRLSYLEFNLEQMMEEELYAEFAVLFRVLHASRMPEKEDAGEDAIIEFYHQEALASGTRIRGELSKAVEQSIKLLANGLLKNHQNKELRERAINGDLKPDDYYLYMLRTVYRMLFLMVIEERNLIYPTERDETLNKKRDIYYKYYSIQRLTKLVESAIYVDPKKTDLWQALMSNFLLFENGHFGQKLGIAPLGSGLFSPDALDNIPQQQMDNETLLQVLRYLVMFENEQGQLTRVNYADLDVEEFGSVYEGLLEYDPEISYGDESHELIFSFKKGDDRSSSGSHYTPEELVKPLIKHSLDYIIEDKLKVEGGLDRKTKLTQQANNLLTITVCDVACGSGHILLSAARRIGFELAKIRESLDQNADVEQPSPPYLRQAIRSVIKHCIYGVDLNPLAVELCKVAFWLEAHNPGEPLNFLDHHIKNGNAIVGLAHLDELTEGIATEAFKTQPGDDKDIASDLRKKNAAERKAREQNKQQGAIAKRLAEENIQKVTDQLNDWARLPEDTPTQIQAKAKAYDKITKSAQWHRLEQLADTQVAQFFLPKTNSSDFITDGQYYQYLINNNAIQNTAVSLATGKSVSKKFFHWFLEFPEVFAHDGFDCVVGNPPYLGGSKISGLVGNEYLHFLRSSFIDFRDKADLVSVFFQRIFDTLSEFGFSSLITTNTISEGVTRVASLDVICKSKGTINHARTGLFWPGQANVVVTLVSFTKRKALRSFTINGMKVDYISPLLNDSVGFPFKLKRNSGKIFYGSKVQGNSFFLSNQEAKQFERLKNIVVFKYLNASELLNRINDDHLKWVVNFSSLELDEVKNKYATLLSYLEPKIKSEKEDFRKKIESNKRALNDRDKKILQKWWQFEGPRVELYKSLRKLDKALVISRVTKTHAPELIDKDYIFSDALLVIADDSKSLFSTIQSSLHDAWAWNYSSKLKSDRRYSPSDAFETYPFNEESLNLIKTGEDYLKHRKQLIVGLQLGLTKIYNIFHNRELNDSGKFTIQEIEKEIFDRSTVRQLKSLYESQGDLSVLNAVMKIIELRDLHRKLDEAVLTAYGWHVDSEKWGEAIELRHDFYEVDYLPENDRVRYTIHPEARKEVLKRLLLLNHERFEEEAKQGLHKKKDVVAFYEQKGVDIPDEVTFSDQKRKPPKKKTTSKSSTQTKGQSALFEEKNLFNAEPSDKPIAKGSSFQMAPIGGSPTWYSIDAKMPGTRTIASTSSLAQAVLGKKAGDKVDFGNGFQILEVR